MRVNSDHRRKSKPASPKHLLSSGAIFQLSVFCVFLFSVSLQGDCCRFLFNLTECFRLNGCLLDCFDKRNADAAFFELQDTIDGAASRGGYFIF